MGDMPLLGRETNKDRISDVQEGKSIELVLINPSKDELELALSLSSLEVLKISFSQKSFR